MPANHGIPDGYHSVQPYLVVKDTETAIHFYARAFGATERLSLPGHDGKIVHAEILIGDSCLMLADENPQAGAKSAQQFGGSPVAFMVYVENCDALFKKAVAAGATSVSEPSDKPYGIRIGTVQDPFGYRWHLGTHLRNVSMDDLKKKLK